MINLDPPVWGKAKYTAQNCDGNSFLVTVPGRDRWGLWVTHNDAICPELLALPLTVLGARHG